MFRCKDAKRRRRKASIEKLFPPIGEGAAQCCHCEGVKRPSQSQDSCNMNEITTSNASHSPRNDTKRTYRPNSYRLKNKLSSRFTLHPSLKQKAAFTLSEVLITLGIIGVVAAMTMPVLIQKNNERAWLTAFKKTYSVLSQAYMMAYEEHGVAREWGTSRTTEGCQKIYTIMSPYLKISDNLGFKRPKGLKRDWRDLNGSTLGNGFFGTSTYNVVLSDGTLIAFNHDDDMHMPILQVDINGVKGPNVMGKDMFYMVLNDKNGYPVISGYAMWWIHNSVSCTIDKNASPGWRYGGGCSTWIISTGNMDYLHRNLTLEEWQKAVSALLIKNGDVSLK